MVSEVTGGRSGLFLLAWLASTAACALTQAQTIGTVAGGGRPGSAATAYSASGASAVAIDASGNLFVAVSGLNQVWVISPRGAVTEVIGNGSGGYSGDGGPAISAGLNQPSGVALDSSGNLYIADPGNSRVRKVTAATGIITTVAGTGVNGYSGDMGPANSAQFNQPTSVALDSAGDLYIADRQNNVIRKVDAATGIIRTVAGNAALTTYSNGLPFGGYSGDGGPATGAGLDQPTGVAVDLDGNLYIADSVFTIVRKVAAATGIITTVAGNGHSPDLTTPNGDGGPATSAKVNVSSVALDSIGNLYIAGVNAVRKVTAATGVISTVAGSSGFRSSGDGGPATSAQLTATAVAVDSAGNLYIADNFNGTVRRVAAASGIITTLAGNNTNSYSGDGGPAVSAQLHNPYGVALNAVGDLYIADSSNGLVRSVAPDTGVIRTVAGHYDPYSSPVLSDGLPATQASLLQTSGIALDSSGNLYLADALASKIRKVAAATGTITTIAGGLITQPGGFPNGYTGDGGPATSAKLNAPVGVVVDTIGNVYIADTYNNVVRKITVATGIITTVAGGAVGYVGDGGLATRSGLKLPTGVALDSTGNLYVADQGNNAIRKVTAGTGIITTIAGNSVQGYSGDAGPASRAQLNQPASVALDSTGNLYIADQGNNAIRKVTVATGVITTIAGNGTLGFTGDGGPGTTAELAHPLGVATGPGGRVYVADTSNNRIRALPAPNLSPPPQVSPIFIGGRSVPAGATAVLSFPIANPAQDQAAMGVSFNSALSSGLVVAAPNGLSGSCGTIAAPEGSRGVAVSGVNLAPGATCTFSVNIAAVGLGVQYATATDLVSGGQPASFFALTNIMIGGAAAIFDSASFGQGTVTPNGISTYFGPVGCSPNEQLLVNGRVAAILFSNATQINFVSPESIAGNPVTIQLLCNGSATVTLTAPAAAVSPSLFTQTGTGRGQGSIVNLDGTINSAGNPIAQGSYISVYGTGFGSTNSPGADGLQHLAATVRATIGGKNATLIYAGQAPGQTSGLQQINIQVPTGIAPGPAVEIVLTANETSTQAGVTVAVK